MVRGIGTICEGNRDYMVRGIYGEGNRDYMVRGIGTMVRGIGTIW